ncbi:MAG TPA: 50S ribosomal protein L35 [Candidatus Paceibacterota bacterium]|nr:50S ribosomal protein L35 [Candidatus Paceibacterota bacterium]
MKTNKSFSKRIKVTKNGKLVVRKPGKNHFNAKESRNTQLANKRSATIRMANKTAARFLPATK